MCLCVCLYQVIYTTRVPTHFILSPPPPPLLQLSGLPLQGYIRRSLALWLESYTSIVCFSGVFIASKNSHNDPKSNDGPISICLLRNDNVDCDAPISDGRGCAGIILRDHKYVCVNGRSCKQSDYIVLVVQCAASA